jgi:hypothetical protein
MEKTKLLENTQERLRSAEEEARERTRQCEKSELQLTDRIAKFEREQKLLQE